MQKCHTNFIEILYDLQPNYKGCIINIKAKIFVLFGFVITQNKINHSIANCAKNKFEIVVECVWIVNEFPKVNGKMEKIWQNL